MAVIDLIIQLLGAFLAVYAFLGIAWSTPILESMLKVNHVAVQR